MAGLTEGEIKTLTVSISNSLEIKIRDQLESHVVEMKAASKEARDTMFEQATGYPWEKRGHFKSTIAWASRAKATSATWRNTGIIAFVGLGVKAFWSDITGN